MSTQHSIKFELLLLICKYGWYIFVSLGMCQVQGCKEGHGQHYCRVCDNPNSTHFSRNCPQGIDLYHGTRVSNITSILSSGLHPSPNGRIGGGIYFAEKDVATAIADHRGQGTGVAVLRVRVNPGKCKTGVHPPWAGVNDEFKEWCL